MEVAPLERLNVRSDGHEQLKDITEDVNEALRRTGVSEGICQVYVPHTTGRRPCERERGPGRLLGHSGVAGQDGAARRGVPAREGNSPGHVKSVLVGQSASLPVAGGRLVLGTWQGVYRAEFDGPRERTVLVTVVGAG